jgi:peptidyl-prolyl cis-trans isomerase SurA
MGRSVKERMTAKHTRNTLRTRITHIGRFALPSSACLMASLVFSASIAAAQAPAQQGSYPVPGGSFTPTTSTLQLPPLPVTAPITPNGSVVEDVVARINDQIITRSEYEAAREGILHDAEQHGATEAELDDQLQNLLRDMIDQQLLLSKGKELGITGEAETMRELDDLRKQNHLDSMEALEKAAAQQGISFEDFKQHMRDQVIQQQVVRDEVGRRLTLTHAAEQAYYDAHKSEFEVPEQVHLSEILVPTPENATDAQITEAQAKADALAAKLKDGANFAALAKSSSGGPTASAGGDLGDFKRGSLGDVLEKATFSLPAGGNTAPIRTRQGFVILHVDSHQAAGVPPLDSVLDRVEQAIYIEQLAPALRAYLTKARQDAYLDITPGFVDTGSPHRSTRPTDIAYTSYTAPKLKKKVQVKQRVEQEKATHAQEELAQARANLAEKKAEKAAQAEQRSGVKNVSMPVKRKKIRKEKIRYGQAPRNSLPKGTALAETTAGAPITGQAPGVAMAPTDSVTSITTGVGTDTDADPLAPQSGPVKKTRFSDHETEAQEKVAQARLAKAETKAETRPVPVAPTEDATEKHQAGPLGLNGDTVKKQKKPRRKKGEEKERLQDKTKPTDTTVPVAPTVNPTLGGPVTAQPAATTTTTTPPPQ